MEKTKTKKRGCLFWGCLTLSIFFLVGGGCTTLVVRKLYLAAIPYTEEKPADLPVYQPSPEEVANLKQRIAHFRRAVEADRPAELRLSADDLNALTTITDWPNKMFFELEDDEIHSKVSFRLEPIPGFSGRYLNVNCSMKIFLENEQLGAIFTSMSIDGKQLPPEMSVTEVDTESVMKEFNKRKEVKALVKNVKDVYVKDGELVFKR